jgi:NADPH2 dehydrogenase
MIKTFEPLELSGMKIKNRVGVAPMCTYLCEKKDGVANDFHFTHYTNLASGQPGLIIQEATAVNEFGYISDHCLGIFNPRQKEALTHLVSAVHRYDTKFGVQLAHAGIKSKHANTPKYGPMSMDDVIGMSHTDIERFVQDFANAAKAARSCGYDFVEIHGAHGYLINQFLSPLTNQREDEYGQDRTLFLKKVVQAVVKAFEGPVFIRLSGDEYDPKGNSVEDIQKIGALCLNLGVCLLNISSGGFANIPNIGPLYQVHLAAQMKKATQGLVATAGLITEPEQIAEIIDSNQSDIVLLGRKFLQDPYFLLQWKYKLGLVEEKDVFIYVYRGLRSLK